MRSLVNGGLPPAESQIWHCGGAAAAALREGTTTSPRAAAGVLPPTLGRWQHAPTSRRPPLAG